MTNTNNFEEISKDKLEASLEHLTIVNDDEPETALEVLAKAITRGVPIPLDTREYREDFSQIIYEHMLRPN